MMAATLESPRWLFSKDRDICGTWVLKILRGEKYHITEEIAEMKAGMTYKHSLKEQLLAFKHRRVFHPFILLIGMMVFRHSSGINVVVYYASIIFSDAGYSNDRASLVSFGAVGCVQVLAALVSVVLVDFLGRRALLIISSVVLFISTSLLGLYFFILNDICHNDLESLKCPNGIEFLPIISMAMFVTGYSLGWGPIPLSSSELLPNQIRTLGGSLGLFTAGVTGTTVLFVFPSYLALVGPKFAWWTLSIIMAMSIVFVALFIPEAKGKSLEEIQEYFEMRKIIACNCCGAKCCWLKHERRVSDISIKHERKERKLSDISCYSTKHFERRASDFVVAI